MWSEQLRGTVRDLTAVWLPPLWTRLLSVAPRLPAKVREWHSAGRHRVLIVAPHPDDELAGCGGTLLRHVAAGDEVTVAVITDGRRSRALDDPERMAAERWHEAKAAAGRTGATLAWWGLPEGDWAMPQLQGLLRRAFESLAPDVLYVPSRVDFHPEHRRVAHACARALAQTRPSVTLRVFEVQVPLGGLANLWCDVSAVAGQCRTALAAYASQYPSLGWMERRWAYTARRHGYHGQAEAFLELSVAHYVQMHADAPEGWPDAFRGLRHHALSDPLAYWVGAAERRRLAAAAAKHAASSG